MKSHQKLDPYFDINYDTKERFCSYWHQINEIISLKPKKAIEIGIGNGFVARYLREKKLNVTTIDIAYDLQPDVAGSVSKMPIIDESFDVVACCEVLEHLPYSEFQKVLKETHRVSRKHVVLSLPDVTTVYRINVELPRIRPIKKLIPHPFQSYCQMLCMTLGGVPFFFYSIDEFNSFDYLCQPL